MNIYAISDISNQNFGITNKARIPLKDGTTMVLKVTGAIRKNGTIKFTNIAGDIMSKGKSVGKTKEYSCNKGLSAEDFAVMIEELGQNAKEPDSVMNTVFDSLAYHTIDFNA